MFKRKYIFLIFIFFTLNSYSQLIEDIKLSLSTKPKPFIKYNTRNSIISTRGARIHAINFGLDFDKKTRLGLGYEWLGSVIQSEKLVLNNNFFDTVNANLKLDYLSIFGEYVFYKDLKWEFSLPIILSFGQAGYYYYIDNKKFKLNRTFVFGYETQMIGQYNIFTWLGVGTGIGYRIMIINRKQINENFTSPIYLFRLKIFFNRLIKK